MASICLHCNVNIDKSDSYYYCDGCQKPIHESCSGLSASEVRCLQLKKRVMKFYCDQCNAGLSSLPSLVESIRVLRSELAEVKKTISTMPAVASAPSGMDTGELVDRVLREYKERENRKVNAVIFGLPETHKSDSAASPDAERVSVEAVLSAVDPNVDLSGLKFFRLGKSKPGMVKPRPIKVVFPSADRAVSIIGKASRLRKTDSFRNVYVNYDKTSCQLEEYQRLKVEMQMRTANGEDGLRISFSDGVHRITKVRSGNKTRLN